MSDGIRIKGWHMILILLLVFVAVYYGYVKIPSITPPQQEVPPYQPPAGASPSAIYSGPLQLNLNTYSLYDDLIHDPDNDVDIKVYHADQVTPFGTATTLDGIDSVTGELTAQDGGILYMAIDHDTGTTEYYLDQKTDAVNAHLTALAPKDVDADGVLEHWFQVDLRSLAPLQAGETQKSVTLNLYCMPADISFDLTSSLNASNPNLSGASYIDLTCEGYVSGVTEGCGFKIVRVELTLPNTANETYVEDGKVKSVWVQLGDTKWTVLSWQPGQDRFLVWEANDVTQEAYAKEYFYAKNAGTTWCRYLVHMQGANFAAGATWLPTLKITYINPAGTIGSVTQVLSFQDT